MSTSSVGVRRPRAYLNIDSAAVMVVTSLCLVGLIAVSFTQSFTALVAVAAWTGLPAVLGWTVPATVDSAILIFTLSALVMHARGQKRATVYAWSMLLLFTVLSIAANVMHAVDSTSGDETRRVVTGAVLAGCAPFVVFTASHMLSLVVIEPPDASCVVSPVVSPVVSRQEEGARVVLPVAVKQPVVVPVATPGAVRADVDRLICDALRCGVAPTGVQVGGWLGGKSTRTGQRYFAALVRRDAEVATLVAGVNASDTGKTSVVSSGRDVVVAAS